MVAYRQRWSSEEEEALEAGVNKYGEGKWSRILKDRKFGPVLHFRSNVDLKDKWRNIVFMRDEIARHKIRSVQKSTRKILKRKKKSKDPDFVGGSYRNGDMGGLRCTRKRMKQKTMSLSQVISSDSRVVRNPLEVLRGRSEVSEIDPIKKTTSRLGNLMVDAITKEMEYRESSRTTVPTYLEKGKWVEVLTQEEGFSDSWYMATVIDTPPQNQDSFASPEKYYVEYETLKDDDDNCQLKESVDAQLIRPLCPILSIDSLQVGDIVDAYYYDGWWIGTITKALPNSRFGITFPPPVTEQEFHISELRIHLDWINGHWYNPNTQSRGADNDASYSRPAKKIKTVNIAEFPASTACKTGTINPNSPSNQSTSLANKATKENKFSELDTDTLDIEKRRRRPPNIHKSSTSGNGSNAGLRTAGGIKEKDCGTIISDQNSQGNVSEGLIIEANMEIPTEFIEKAQPIVSSAKLVNPSELSHSIVVGVRTSEGRDCETEDIAPILIDLTCDETISPQCNIPCESPPEGEQTFVITQNNQGSIPERNIIENRAAELQFTVRDSVEVSFEKDNYNVWFPATVLKSFPDNSYLVHFMCKKGQEISPHSATVSLPHIRPKPPQRKSKSKSFVLLDMVDAFHGCAWTRGKIIQEYPDNRFVVSFNRKKTKLFGKYKLRPHMDWVDGRWIDASKSRDDENDASNLRLSKKIKTVNVAEVPTSTACDTDTMSSKLSSKQVMKEKKSSEPSLKNPTIVSRSERPPKVVKPLTNGHESNTGVIKSPLMGQKCSLWDCTRPSAQGFDHCSNHHADLALKEGTLGMNPVLRPGGTGVKESLFYAVLNAKAENKDVGIPECERASTAKCPWNAPELFDINVHENETVRDWLFFDKPRKAFKHGNRKQLSLPDHQGRGWHESRKQVMNEFNAQKKSYYMDPQPNKGFEWHLYEYEIFNFNACVLYRLEYKRVCDKKSTKGKSPNDSVAYLEKQMEIPTGGNERYPGVRSAERTEESDFEMEDSSPILNELPINGMRTPQHDIPCQFPPERSQTFISDQNCQGNVSAGLIIEESMENRLSKLRETSPGLSEPRSRIKIPIESPYSIVDGVRAVEEREEEDSETGGIAPIFIDLTSDETISPQHSSPCQLSLERSGTFIFDQNGGGNFPARLIIEENEENSLTDQVRMSQELLESRNMMELHIENDSCVMSSAKPVKHYVRKRLKRSENPCFESPDLSVDGGTSSKETEVHNVADTSTPGIDHDVNQVLPFKKTLSLWDTIESMEEFRLFPQKPHFRSLENVDEYCREGVALSQMVTFSNIVKKLTEMGIETLRSSKEKCLENLIALEENGFDVRNIRDRLKSLEQESQVMELKKKKRKINEDVDEMDKLLKELGEKRVAAMSKMEIRASATEASRSLLNNINDRVNRIKFDFEEMVATRW